MMMTKDGKIHNVKPAWTFKERLEMIDNMSSRLEGRQQTFVDKEVAEFNRQGKGVLKDDTITAAEMEQRLNLLTPEDLREQASIIVDRKLGPQFTTHQGQPQRRVDQPSRRSPPTGTAGPPPQQQAPPQQQRVLEQTFNTASVSLQDQFSKQGDVAKWSDKDLSLLIGPAAETITAFEKLSATLDPSVRAAMAPEIKQAIAVLKEAKRRQRN